jgi:hypothetical protein
MYFVDNAGVVEEVNIDGTVVELGNIGVTDMTGMAFDYTSGIYYLADWTGNIYTFDVASVSVTLVGGSGIANLIAITCDADGNLWGYNVGDNNFFQIDKATGASTLIGNIGFTANYGQGMGYDGVNDMVVMACYNTSGAGAEYRSVDVTTGMTTLIAPIGPSGTQFGTIAMPFGGGGGSGTVPDGLVAFNVYRDSDFIAEVPYEGQGVDEWVWYIDNPVDPGTYKYDVSAVYDLSVFGFIGETGESMWEGTDTVTVVWGFDLPFFEDWAQGSFDFQGWRSNDANWKMNAQVGNDEPSAEFSWDPLLEDDYSSTLTTNPLKADMLTEGSIFVDFDLKLDDRNSTGEEKMVVEVKSAGGAWEEVATFVNNGSFDFTANHLEITGDAMGEVFQVRFNAMGMNSFDIVAWYVDNIHVYRECAAPRDLTGEYYWNDSELGDDYGALVCWNIPDIPQPIHEWIHWDTGDNAGAIGLTTEGPFSVAARWDAGMLDDYDGTFITKIAMFPADAGFSTVTVKVWYGPDAATLVAEKEVALADLTIGMYNEIVLDDPVEVDASQELWVGYTIVQVGTGVFPAGHDQGPAVVGYGDKVSLDGSTWDNLSDFGPDFNVNWNIDAYLEEMTTPQTGITPLVEEPYNSNGASFSNTSNDELIVMDERSDRDFNGFILYRRAPGETEYTELATIPYVEGQEDYCYTDEFDNVTGPDQVYSYQVTATWASATDACESSPGYAKEEPANDYVDVLVTDIDNPNAGLTQVYPNPATDRVNITSSAAISRLTVVNYTGQVVYRVDLDGATTYTLNTASYEDGVYVIRMETANDVITKRVIIAQ